MRTISVLDRVYYTTVEFAFVYLGEARMGYKRVLAINLSDTNERAALRIYDEKILIAEHTMRSTDTISLLRQTVQQHRASIIETHE